MFASPHSSTPWDLSRGDGGIQDPVFVILNDLVQLHDQPGILADDDSPGNVLDCEARAPDGVVPLWGQSGSFEITHGTMRVRIDMEGIFGISACHTPWLGFAAHAVDLDQPFLSETGYRSFVGLRGELGAGLTPDAFVADIIAAHVKRELKGRLLRIAPEYRRTKVEAA